MSKTIFVYGTLRKGMANYEKFLKGHVRKITTAYIKGTMYMLKSEVFPAVVAGNDMIKGEIIQLKKNREKVLKAIDKIEGFHYDDSPDNLYDKELYDVFDAEGNLIGKQEIYLYNIALNPQLKDTLGEKIAENDFVKYCNKKSKY